MTFAATILGRARALGVSLRVEGDRIKAKGPQPAIEQILPALREHKPELLAALSGTTAIPDPAESSGHWLIVQSPRLEKWFSRPVTRAELGERYPGAALIALHDATEELRATAEQEAELRRLIGRLANAKGFTDAERAEAVANALRRPAEALTSLKAMMREVGIV